MSSITETVPRFTFRPISTCWICGGSRLKKVIRCKLDLSQNLQFGDRAHTQHPDYWVNKCLDCSHGQPDGMPDDPHYFDMLYQQLWGEEFLNSYYDWGDKDYIFRTILARLNKILNPALPRTILDVGTFVGRFVGIARTAHWDAEGIEKNSRAVKVARERTGAVIHEGTAETLQALGKQYAVVVFSDVLEHIPEPMAVLRSLRELVLPGGILAVKVPHGAAQRFKERIRGAFGAADAGVGANLTHVNHFTPKSLRLALRNAGFDDVRIECGAPEFSPPEKRKTLKQKLSPAIRLSLYHLANILPGGLHMPFAFNLQAYARNPG